VGRVEARGGARAARAARRDFGRDGDARGRAGDCGGGDGEGVCREGDCRVRGVGGGGGRGCGEGEGGTGTLGGGGGEGVRGGEGRLVYGLEGCFWVSFFCFPFAFQWSGVRGVFGGFVGYSACNV